MSIFNQRLSKKVKIQIAAISVGILTCVVLVVLDIIFKGPLTNLLTNKEQIVDFINSLGIFGPLAFMLIQILQTVVAPIPGQVSGIVGGFIFGWWGILWTIIGSGIGFFLVFLLSRKFGRGLVERIIKKEHLDKFDYLTKQKGSFVFFLIFLIPGLPDDIVCYVAGLTTIPIRKLMWMITLGRLPAVIMTNLLGAGLGEADIRPIVVAVITTVFVLAAVAYKHKDIMKFIERQSKLDEPK